MEIIPAIDLLGGRCVRLYQGDFRQVSEYDHDPLELARSYHAAGLETLHVVDLDGARTGEPVNHAVIARLATESGMTVQSGGGIRDIGRLNALLACGVHRAVVGSVAVTDRATAAQWLGTAGPERLVLAFDVRIPEHGDPEAVTHGWTRGSGQALWALVEYYLGLGARHFLCTDVARDGTLEGTNTRLYRECSRRYPEACFQASGGLGSARELPLLQAAGVSGVITGKALLDGRLSLEEIGTFLQNA